jgi:hypothetical protein
VVAAGGAHLQRPRAEGLATHVGQVGLDVELRRAHGARNIGPRGAAFDGGDHLPKGGHAAHQRAIDEGCLRRAATGDDDRRAPDRIDQRHHTGHRAHRAVQTQLAEEGSVRDPSGVESALGREDRDGDRQIKP